MSNDKGKEYYRLFDDNPGVPCDDAWKNDISERINRESESTIWPPEVERIIAEALVEWNSSLPSGAVVVYERSGDGELDFIIRYPDNSYRWVTDNWYRWMSLEDKYVPIRSLHDEYYWTDRSGQDWLEDIFSQYLYEGKDSKYSDDDYAISRITSAGGSSNTVPISYESVLSERFFNGEYDDMLNSYVDDEYKKDLIKESKENTGHHCGKFPNCFLPLSWEDYYAAVDTAVNQNKHFFVAVRDILYKGEK